MDSTVPKIFFLTEAWLTYPYHCCAFNYPATHDPKEHAKHEHIVEGIRSGCSDKATAAPEVIVEEVEDFEVDRRVGRAPLARLSDAKEEDDGEFGKIVFYPDNKSRHVEPDWSALTASQRPQHSSNQFDPYHLDPHHSFHDLGEGTMATQHTPGSGNDQVARLRTLFTGSGVFHQDTVAHTPSLLSAVCGNLSRHPRTVECHPEPDPFNPCEDIMGNWWLRVSAWLMGILSLLGNIAVLFVLLSCQFRMSVSKILMCNLAIADLSMGIYLMSILVMDARTIGVYFNHAIDWQEGPGCQIAGFLTVFASELSIFTLAMITSERWYAITYAMHLDRRLRVGTATKVMAAGWVYAAVVAALPLVGISGYSKTSICLPMENRDLAGKIYVILLLVINGLAFILICACYGNIYYVIRKNSQERRNRARANNEKGDQGSPQWWGRTNVGSPTNSDATVAKRMALLVFTDFACKAPIAFFGLTAMAGMPLIDVTHAKILLVFFYPLNSCANPFLYALLTKQYRRDLFTMLSRHGLFANKAARYKGAFPGVNNDATAKGAVGAARNPGVDRKTTGCWQNCSGPNRRGENHISFLQGFYHGTGCNHTEPTPFVSQPSSQRGSFLTQMSSVDGGFKVVPANSHKIRHDSGDDAVIAVTIELDEMDRKAMTNPPSESEEVSTDRPHSDGCESYPMKSIKDSKSSWSRSGSPHPIRSSMTRLTISDDQEEILRRALAKVSKSSPSSPHNMVEPSSNI